MDIVILTIGTEILKGCIANSNAEYMAGRLYSSGFKVSEIRTVGDDERSIKEALRDCFRRAGVVIASGGLGPTRDDVTKKSVARFFNLKLATDPELLAGLKRFFTRLGYDKFPQRSRNQAVVPKGARILPNPRGTASGLLIEREGKLLFLLPGVPVEMRGLLDEEVLPILCGRFGMAEPETAVLRTVGLGESTLAEKVEQGLSTAQKSLLGYYPHGGFVDIVIASPPSSAGPVKKGDIRRTADHVSALVKEDLYARDEKGLFEVIAGLLSSRGLTLAVAESCTGGLLSKTITDLPGASDYFDSGVVSYSNQSKMRFLGVPDELIAEHGAVSKAAARAMAEGLARETGADLNLAITGIAGPAGGTKIKPVGTIFIAITGKTGKTEALRFNFTGDREQIRHRSMIKAAELLWRRLK